MKTNTLLKTLACYILATTSLSTLLHAASFKYSPVVDLKNGVFSSTTASIWNENGGISWNILNPMEFNLKPGDDVSGTLLFVNNQRLKFNDMNETTVSQVYLSGFNTAGETQQISTYLDLLSTEGGPLTSTDPFNGAVGSGFTNLSAGPYNYIFGSGAFSFSGFDYKIVFDPIVSGNIVYNFTIDKFNATSSLGKSNISVIPESSTYSSLVGIIILAVFSAKRRFRFYKS